MSKKELADRNDRRGLKHKLQESNPVEGAELLQTQPSTIIQQAGIDPRLLAPHDVQQLQRMIGNHATSQLLAGSSPLHQRQELSEGEEELQLKTDIPIVGPEGGPLAPEVQAAIQNAKGGGQPLQGTIQAQMGEALDHDFSDVRVHTGEQADALNQALSARAFTTGQDIFFHEGEYNPGSGTGQELLAHELTHVVQQSSGKVRSSEGSMTVRPAGDAFEKEADRHMISQSRPSRTRASAHGTIIQRDMLDDIAKEAIAGVKPESENPDYAWFTKNAENYRERVIEAIREYIRRLVGKGQVTEGGIVAPEKIEVSEGKEWLGSQGGGMILTPSTASILMDLVSDEGPDSVRAKIAHEIGHGTRGESGSTPKLAELGVMKCINGLTYPQVKKGMDYLKEDAIEGLEPDKYVYEIQADLRGYYLESKAQGKWLDSDIRYASLKDEPADGEHPSGKVRLLFMRALFNALMDPEKKLTPDAPKLFDTKELYSS